MARQPDPLLAAERAVTRWVRLLRDIQGLTLEGSIEPRKWIGCSERFWLGMAEDAGDWLHVLATDPADPDAACGPVAGPGIMVESVLSAGDRTHKIDVDVPLGAFDALESERVVLWPSPLRCGGDLMALPWRHVVVEPAVVSSDAPRSTLRLMDLPTYHPGMVLFGTVWAEPAAGANGKACAALPVCEVRVRVG